MTAPDEPWPNGQLDAGQQVGRGIIRHEVDTGGTGMSGGYDDVSNPTIWTGT